jgi:alpha-L-fucosidase
MDEKSNIEQALLDTIPAVAEESTYVWPKENLVLDNLKKWQGYKFGILIHMGLYSHLGIIESWTLCPEDEEWINRNGYDDYFSFAADYRNTKDKFNPVKFDAEKWARTFKEAGAKYMIFSTKHHDGFCMYDSKYTDFKITDKNCPYSSNPKPDITKNVFDAFRSEKISVGAYFSKPDWSNSDFWWPYFPPKDRNPNYNVLKHPDKWNNFIEYTHNQLEELSANYGPLDILWLDGCWIRPYSTLNEHVAVCCKYPHDLDMQMDLAVKKVRKNQPGMLIVDRWVPGENENYMTPEQQTPEKALKAPWESCITLGKNWGWVPNEQYKSARNIIHLLINIVAKGGNLLLGIGPDGQGDFDPDVYERLNQIGRWLKNNGEAIYNTTPVEPYKVEKIAYTMKGENTVFAIYLIEEDEKVLPEQITIKTGFKGRLNICLPEFKIDFITEQTSDEFTLFIPESLRTAFSKTEALVIKIQFLN